MSYQVYRNVKRLFYEIGLAIKALFFKRIFNYKYAINKR